MAGKGWLALAITLIIISAFFLAFGARATAGYLDRLGVHNEKEAELEGMQPGTTEHSAMEKLIEVNEGLMRPKAVGMGVHLGLGVLFIVLGIFFILRWRKARRGVEPEGGEPEQ